MVDKHFLQFFLGDALVPTVEDDLVLVIMPFSDELKDRYDNLLKAPLEKSGFRVIRTDDIYGTNLIMANIVSLMQRCRLVIADLTGRNPNVLYELGLACGFVKDVFLIADSLHDIPADLRHLTFYLLKNKARQEQTKAIHENVHYILKKRNRSLPMTVTQRVISGCDSLGIVDIVPSDIRIMLNYALKAKKSIEAIGLTGKAVFNLDIGDYKELIHHLNKLDVCIVMPSLDNQHLSWIDDVDGVGKGATRGQLINSIKRFTLAKLNIRFTNAFFTWGGIFIDNKIAILQFYSINTWQSKFIIIRRTKQGIYDSFYSMFANIKKASFKKRPLVRDNSVVS